MRKVLSTIFALGLILLTGASPAEAQIRPGCPAPGARSPSSQAQVPVTVVNSSYDLARLYWVDFNGNSVLYSEIRRGARYNVNSYIGHLWVLIDGRGRCISTFAIAGDAYYDF